ncbi:MAG: PAS domain-containing protein [Pseudomonadota bacterium]
MREVTGFTLPSIRSRIAMLVLVCALPSAISFAALVHHFYERERDQIARNAQHTARALSAALDRDLGNRELAVRVLASSPYLLQGDFAAFHTQAGAMLGPQDRDAAVILSDRDGNQLLNTRLPYGQQLPPRGNQSQLGPVFEKGQTVISDLFYGRVLRQNVLSVDVPVRRDGHTLYSLGTAFAPARLARLLVEQQLAPEVLASFIDAKGVIVARSRAAQQFVGKPASSALRERLRSGREGSFDTVTAEGVPVLASYARSPQTGWSVVIGVPRDTVLKELLGSVAAISAALAALLLTGFVLAWRLGGRLSGSITELTVPARQLAADLPLRMPVATFREAQEVVSAFADMADRIQNHRLQMQTLVTERTVQLEKSNGLLEIVYANAPVGLCLLDQDLRLLMVNPYLAELAARPAEEQLGQRLSDLLGEIGAAIDQACRQAYDSGLPVINLALSGAVPASPQEVRYLSASYYPVFDHDGRVIGLTGMLLDVSDQKRLEARLRDNEEYFRVLYECSQDAHMLTTLGAGFVGANQAAADLFGCRDIEQLTNMSPATCSPEFQPDGQRSGDKAQAMMRLALEQGGHVFEWLHRRVDGSEFHADVLLSRLDIGGQGIMQATVRDISARKQAELALSESRRLLTSILEHMPAMVFVKRAADMRYQIFNRAGEQILGIARETVIGKQVDDLVPAEQADAINALELDVLRSHASVENEMMPVKDATGATRYLTIRRVALRDEAGNATHLLGVAIDVTERERAMRSLNETSSQLRHSERFLRTVTDNLPGMVAYWDADLVCRFINKRYIEWYGMTLAEIGQTTLAQLMGEQTYQASRPYLDGVLRGQAQSFEREMTLADGTVRHSWVNYIPDPGADGKVAGFFVLISDVTVLKQAELRLHDLNEELVRARDKAEAASSAKSEFLANMSHEIRTPMNAIIGLARLLEESPLERRERSYVAKIQLATQSLLAVLNDVLDFSKIEAGHLALEQTRFQLDSLLTSTAVLVAGNAWAKGVEPVFAVAPEVPAELVGDPMRLQQVLLNLMGNAIKFTERGEVLLSIGVGQQDEAGVTLQCAVRDSGIGIDAAQQQHIFDAFSQGDNSTSRKYGGTGLGLAISRRLVGLMGGSISVTSELGRGSAFSFTARFSRPAGAGPALTPPGPDQPALHNLSLLIVDDNASVRQALKQSCAALGWHAECAANAGEALAKLRDAARAYRMPDLLLLDSAMPDVDGISMMMLARADHLLEVPPVIMMVPEHQSENLAQIAVSLELAGILSKPCTGARMLVAVTAARTGGGTELAAVPLPSAIAGRLAGLRLLLVEDNEINQEVAQYILLHSGARVEVAGNGQLAVNRLRTGEHYDAVLMDIQMPVMNGYQATVAIRALGLVTLPIIAMTANVMADDRQRAINAGMDAHISKPIDVEELLDTVLRLCGPARTGKLERADPAGAPAAVLPAALPGIDLDSALPRFGGNYVALIGLLKRFENSQGDAVGEVRRLVGEGKAEQAGQVLHRLRGVAANLGAAQVSELSLQAEQAMHQGRESELAALLGALDTAMAVVIAAARTLPMPALPALAEPDGAAAPTRRAAADAAHAAAALGTLLVLLQNSNLEALHYFQAQRPLFEAMCRERSLALAEAIETLSFPAAEALVQELLKRKEEA